MTYQVFLLEDAEEDIYEIYHYIATTDSFNKAESLFQKLMEQCFGLSEFPYRGHVPPELERLAIFDFREIHCEAFRIIYRIKKANVYIHCILDGRRNIQELLENRLF